MRFEWDEQKNQTNVSKHGLDFADAWEIFTEPMLTALDSRKDYGEDRWISIGVLQSRAVVIVYTERGEDTVRVISLRKAGTHERLQYEQARSDQLGTG